METWRARVYSGNALFFHTLSGLGVGNRCILRNEDPDESMQALFERIEFVLKL
jgi:hypothetical protein